MLRNVRTTLLDTAKAIRSQDADVAELLTRLAKDQPLCKVYADETGDVSIVDLPTGEIEIMDVLEDGEEDDDGEW